MNKDFERNLKILRVKAFRRRSLQLPERRRGSIVDIGTHARLNLRIKSMTTRMRDQRLKLMAQTER